MEAREHRRLTSGESRFRELIEKAADGVLVLWQDGSIAYANPAAADLLNRERTELEGIMFGTPVSAGEKSEIDLCLPGSDLPTCIVEMRVVEVEWEDKPALLATLRDVTQRKQAASALAFLSEAGKRLARSLDYETTLDCVASLALEHLADWCLIDLVEGDFHDGHVHLKRLACDHRGPTHLQLTKQLTGWYPLDCNPLSSFARILQRGEVEVYVHPSPSELLMLALQPSRIETITTLGCHSAMIAPMIARGRVIGAITFVTSTRWRVYDDEERTLASHLADRAALAIDNARLYVEAQEALRRRDEFLATLAHELRNPLAPILTAVELLKHPEQGDESRDRHLLTIERQGHHLSRLLDDLLDLSRIAHGKIDLRIMPIDLAGVVRDALQVARGIVHGRRHHLTFTVDHSPLIVEGDATRLAQVVGNLLTNAARYTESGGKIELRAFRQEHEIVIQVRDTGRGIPREMQERIFDPFTQINASFDRSEGGLGIGLTLVRRLVELHRGKVSVSSEGIGHGSTFEIRLPASNAELPSIEKKITLTIPRRILLIEDNADGREMLGELLRLWGHTVELASDGIAGLEKVREYRPDVALIDIGLPGLNGYRVAESIRRLPGGSELLLVAMTGYGLPEDREQALAAGFDEHLVKPVDLIQLSEVMNRVH